MKIAIIRMKGKIGIPKPVKDTMRMLRLFNKYTCSIIENRPHQLGMVSRIKDYITWGEIDEETFTLLLTKRGKLPGKKLISQEYIKEKTKLSVKEFSKEFISGKKKMKDIPGLKPFFKLKPPEKGFERGGTKKHYISGGALGYRRKNINQLIQRMI